jgi:hypothetical protein
MKNQITANVEFSYKGEVFTPSTIIDLDNTMAQQDLLPSIHRMIAQENKIDTYSYLYEVMEQAEIIFTNAQGLAIEFLSDTNFDFSAFQGALCETRHDQMCQEIAATEMGVTDLDKYPGLKSALIKAYALGKKDTV